MEQTVPKLRLDEISTEWSIIRDPSQFVMRYAPAIRRYFGALIKNRHDAEEVAQDFFMRVTQHGFVRVKLERSRFRDYLKAAVRNAALNFLRCKQVPSLDRSLIAHFHAADQPPPEADRQWVAEWRQCLLEWACRALECHELQSPGNLSHTVLGLLVAYPQEDTKKLAARASALSGHPLRPEAFRKQVSRARRLLARLLAREVAQTLDNSTPGEVKEELIELGLWGYVRDFLPTDWLSHRMATVTG
jgi:hypothetical protein